MNDVELEWYEGQSAGIVGLSRRMNALRQGLKEPNGKPSNWNDDIEGAMAEAAFAKAINKYWAPSIGTFKSLPDVHKFEIRHTRLLNGRLIVRDRDKSDAVYVLVTGTFPKYKIVGGMSGLKAKQKKYLYGPNHRPPAYFVPQDQLMDINEILKVMGRRNGISGKTSR